MAHKPSYSHEALNAASFDEHAEQLERASHLVENRVGIPKHPIGKTVIISTAPLEDDTGIYMACVDYTIETVVDGIVRSANEIELILPPNRLCDSIWFSPFEVGNPDKMWQVNWHGRKAHQWFGQDNRMLQQLMLFMQAHANRASSIKPLTVWMQVLELLQRIRLDPSMMLELNDIRSQLVQYGIEPDVLRETFPLIEVETHARSFPVRVEFA
jgi:hypothetical protein